MIHETNSHENIQKYRNSAPPDANELLKRMQDEGEEDPQKIMGYTRYGNEHEGLLFDSSKGVIDYANDKGDSYRYYDEDLNGVYELAEFHNFRQGIDRVIYDDSNQDGVYETRSSELPYDSEKTMIIPTATDTYNKETGEYEHTFADKVKTFFKNLF